MPNVRSQNVAYVAFFIDRPIHEQLVGHAIKKGMTKTDFVKECIQERIKALKPLTAGELTRAKIISEYERARASARGLASAASRKKNAAKAKA